MASNELRNAVLQRFPLASAPKKETVRPRVAVEDGPPIGGCKGTPDMPKQLLKKSGLDLLGEVLENRNKSTMVDVDEEMKKGVREKANAHIDRSLIEGILS